MGNDIEENNLNQIDKEEIIENDCYEEIDLNKINKIIEKEKNWNKNSIIVSLNELDLKKLNEDNENIEGNKEKVNNNEELACKVIEEQKNEEGSEDGNNKENKENEQNEQNNDNNDNNVNNVNNNEKENEKEKKELNENKNDNNNEINKNEINNEINNNEANDKVNGIINISNRQDENKKEDVPEENNNADNAKDTKDTKDNNNNEDNAGDDNDKNNQVREKIKNKVKKGKKPRIRPKNTSDEALKGANGKIAKYRKQRNNNNNNNNDKSLNQNDGKADNNAKNDNNKNEANKNEKKINNQPVEKKDPSEEFDIKNIISEYRLNHLKDDEIIYSGTLDKILKIPDKNTIAYSQRFCIFTKKYFAYYKSKESYISLNKPMLLINNKFIIRIENTILDGGSYYFGIICEVNDETRSLINKVNSFVTNEANTCELLLGFRTKEYENMMKWVVVLRYFISNQKEDF